MLAWLPRATPGARYDSTMVPMLRTPTPAPYRNGAPGCASWCTTRPASTSALATTTMAAIDAGAVEPAEGDGARIAGTSSSPQTISLSRQTSSSWSGGDDMVRQARLPAVPQVAAISVMTRSGAPPNGLETTMGLRVPASMAASW